jgi:signal transduction histidine kinase
MLDVTGFQLATVTVHTTAAIVWGSVALREWETCRRFRPRSPLFRLLWKMMALGAVHFAAEAVVCLLPADLLEPAPRPWVIGLFVVSDWSLLLVGPIAWHVTHYWGGRSGPPTRRTFVLLYGSAMLMMALTVTFPIVFQGLASPLLTYVVLRNVYLLVVFASAVFRMSQVARRGRWRPGAAGSAILRADIWFFGGGLIVMASVAALLAAGGLPGHGSPTAFVVDTAVNVLVTIPIAVRELTYVVRGVLFAGGMLAALAGTFFASRALVAPLVAGGAPHAADVAMILMLAAVLMPAQAGLRHAIHRLVLRRRAHLWNDLRTFLTTLSPDAGALVCCRAALGEIVRVLGLHGAAILLRDGEAVVEGRFQVDRLREVWPRDEALDALPPALVTLDYLDELPRPVVEALIEAEVVGVVPITSPRRRWGALFATSGFLEPVPEEGDAVEAFVAQLALLLDAAALLERTVAVERSLAHAEKLAAIGELAARIAHEIRNPITAARSLAQLLARDPTAPENTEHAALILDELERVERQVRSLLHFARREDYHFESVDLGALVESTLSAFAPRLATLGVRLDATVTAGVVVRGDREKLRQVLVNLLENALDALALADERCLATMVSTTNGTVSVSIADSGPGIPPDALGHLFEPFFTLKPNGTGLGLAIARRTIEAHGGRIDVAPATPRGTTFRLDLPTAREAT